MGLALDERNPWVRPLGFVVYLLTFNCYGTHLRGDQMGSVDRTRQGRGGPVDASVALVNYGQRIMTYSEASLIWPKPLWC